MAVTADKPAPYAPPGTLLQVIERHRQRGLPAPITGETLGRAGVPDSLLARTLQAMQTLDLINDKGEPTPTFEGIRKAPEAEYKQRIVEWLNGAYADVLQFVDPATATETEIRDAFRNYVPVGQQPRMVSLFVGLYASADARPEKVSQPRPPKPMTPRPRLTEKPAGRAPAFSRKVETRPLNSVVGPLPPMLSALLAGLPLQGQGWTQQARDKFVAMFATVLDYSYPIHDETDDEEGPDGSRTA